MCVTYIYILLPKPSLRPPFVNLFEKAPISRDLSFKHSPSPPRCPPVFLAKSCRSLTSVRRNRKCKRRNFSRVNILFSVLVYTANSAMPLIVRFFDPFFLSFSSFFFSKIVGRRTRVIGQGSKTWKGYRNSLFPPFLLSLFSHLVSIFFFVLCLSLSLSSPLFLSLSLPYHV